MERRTVAVVVHEGVQALDVAGPLDAFAEANAFVAPDAGYDIVVVAHAAAPMRASNGMLIAADVGFEAAQRAFHTALVAGGPALPDRPGDPRLSAWLRDWGSRAERYGSICTGAFALGHAGLLDDRVVTTHWQNAPRLAAMFPRARVELDRIYMRDGPLLTSAGVTAGIDLALALIAEDHGAEIALACAKRLVVVAQRQGGQSQFSAFLALPQDPASPLGRLQAHVLAHPGESYPMARLAELAGTSVRSLARLFRAELGVTPHEFVNGVRLDHARNLLESSPMPMKQVAYACGFGGAEQMRVAFQRRLGLSPAAYRSSFRPADRLRARA